MKSILVPTDFSACANDAADAAMQIARYLGAKVHLYSRVDLPWNWHTLTEMERSAHREAQQRLRNAEVLMADLVARYPNLPTETHLSGGNLVENIVELAEALDVDLIVMGSHGTSGKNDLFLGTNTQKVVRMVHRPVLVVKEPLGTVKFEKVVFAANFNPEDKPVFLQFKEFIRPFLPEIHLVYINTTGFFGTPLVVSQEVMQDFCALAKPFDCHFHIYHDVTAELGIRSFSEKIGAQLIAVAHHHRSPIARMFIGSTVEALVNHSRLPVLSLDYNKKDLPPNQG
ncbi:MAG: universal stress protein [Bacteroidetes bacterium]|nr:MAG: universal stress protein [Bacteroidota bacterium]